ncbi:MAG: hypothetical protein AB7R40_22390 [Nitrospiraceae bacterium]
MIRITEQGPSVQQIVAELRRLATEMAKIWPAYTGYGPSSNYFRERMPGHWPKIQAITRRMGAQDWAGVLRVAGLKFPSRGMMIEFSHHSKRTVAPWEEREPETALLLPPGCSLRSYDGMPAIERRRWGEFVRRVDDEHVLIRVVTVYEVR